MGEDAGRLGRQGAAQVLAGLRNRLVPVLANTADRVAAAVRTMSNCFNKARTLLGLPPLE